MNLLSYNQLNYSICVQEQNQQITASFLTCSKKVNKIFLWFYMNHSSLFLESVKLKSNSTTIDVIYSNVLSEIKFPLPTIHEQTQIVSNPNRFESIRNETCKSETRQQHDDAETGGWQSSGGISPRFQRETHQQKQ